MNDDLPVMWRLKRTKRLERGRLEREAHYTKREIVHKEHLK